MPVILAAEAATFIGIIPLLWLALLHFRGKPLDVAWWWIAGAFLVSWIADNASRFTGHPLVSVTYPVSQAAIIGFVFLSRTDALYLVVVLVAVGLLDVLSFGVQGPDILLRTVAWLSVVGIVWSLRQLGRLRTSLLVAFGLGWLCWMGYAIWPGWTSWGLYQGVRLAGILLFCWAATSPLPQLKLAPKKKPRV